jgi:hypothetical protein
MRRITVLLTTLVATSALMACGTETDVPPTETDPIEQLSNLGSYNLEADDGDVDDGDEAEAAAALDDAFPEDNDAAREAAPELADAADARVHRVRLVWGQLRGNPDAEDIIDWSGTISVDHGAVAVARTVRFEDADGIVRPRPDAQTLGITSHTRPHHDGLVLLIADRAAGGANALHIDLGPASFDIPLDTLADTREVRRIDDAGNRVALEAVLVRDGEPEAPDCAQGFLQGRWRQTGEHRGRFAGRWTEADGESNGYIAGIYGTRENGDHVMLGKYFGPNGAFRGRIRGTYTPGGNGEGHFEAHWMGRDGENRGALRGAYISGERAGTGFFRGSWANAACRAEADE